MKPIDKLLADKKVDLWFADELWTGGGTRRAGWTGISDVSCSLQRGAVAVPRRRRGGHHFAEVIHEVVHLELWRATGKRPAKQDDAEVCRLALQLGEEYGFTAYTLECLRRDMAEQLAKRASADHSRAG